MLTILLALSAQAAGSAYQQSSTDGLVVMEAERCGANQPQGSHTWDAVTSPAGFVGGGAMKALPDAAVSYEAPQYVTQSPRLDFRVNFVKTGTHYVFVRGVADPALPGQSDSVHAGLDGLALAACDRIAGFAVAGYDWHNNTLDSAPATFDVPSTGLHTVNLWMREDGFTVDRVVVTPNPNFFANGDRGEGPAESPQQAVSGSGSAAPAVSAVSSGGNNPNGDGGLNDQCLGRSGSAAVEGPVPFWALLVALAVFSFRNR